VPHLNQKGAAKVSRMSWPFFGPCLSALGTPFGDGIWLYRNNARPISYQM